MNTSDNKEVDKSWNSSLTPVRFLDSLNLKSPTMSANDQANVATCKSRLEIIIQKLKEDYIKWQKAQERGLWYCKAIVESKRKCLTNNETSMAATSTLYPDKLQTFCDKLTLITEIFADVTENARQALRQTRALSKLNKCASAVCFRSWRLTDFTQFIVELVDCYEMETAIKQRVIQEIPHGTNYGALTNELLNWEYPLYANDWLDLQFAFLNEETQLNKKYI